MRHVATALVSFSLLWSLSTKAMNITEPQAQDMKIIFFTLLKDYHGALVSAMKQGLHVDLTEFVEPASPWHTMISTAQKDSDWQLPPYGGACAPYYPYPLFSLYAILRNLEHQEDEISIIKNNNILYDFILKGMQVTVTYKNNMMKLHGFEIEGLARAHLAQLM